MLSLKRFKNGSSYDYPAVMSVYERLPGMVKRDPQGTTALIVVGLTMAFENMNLSRPMNDGQIMDLADTILESSEEDCLALEDVMLFLQGLTRGKYGPLFESMDIPKFMEKFELYRKERHLALLQYREEKNSQYKVTGRMDRHSDNQDRERELDHSAMVDYMRGMYSVNPAENTENK